MTRRPGAVCFATLMSLVSGGCTFHRLQSNHQFAELEPGRIQVGKSNWRDVLTELGPPSGATTASIRGMDGMVMFHYSRADQKTFSMLLAYLLVLPFRWGDEQTGSDLIVEFDPAGIVADVYLVEDRAVWRPFQDPVDNRVTFYRDEVAP